MVMYLCSCANYDSVYIYRFGIHNTGGDLTTFE
jgi:hypothetical protein